MNQLQAFGISHPGRVREENEDSWCTSTRGERFIAVVADGMGGHESGKLASSTAIQTLMEGFSQDRTDAPPTEEIVENSLFSAHKRILRMGVEKSQKTLMGTTCSIAVLEPIPSPTPQSDHKPMRLVVGHVGDSRIYRLDGRVIDQLTTDHTMSQRMIDAGLMDSKDLGRFSLRNVIYRSLGGAQELKLDESLVTEISPGNILVLCSDGLTEHVAPGEIHRVMRGTGNIEEAGNYLVEMANHRGGSDNITAVLVEYGRFPRQSSRQRKRECPPIQVNTITPEAEWKRRRRRWIVSLLIILLVLCAWLTFILIRSDGSDPVSETRFVSPDSMERDFRQKPIDKQRSQEAL